MVARLRSAAVSAVFVLPVLESGRGAPIASLLSTAAWASAGARVYDESWIVSPAGLMQADEARRLATPDLSHEGGVTGDAPEQDRGSPALRSLRFVPTPAKTLLKDVRSLARGRTFRVDTGPWDRTDVDLVWQRHELFGHAGLDLADRLDVPSVLFAPAVKVWEAERWGTRRPGWGRLLERTGETPSIRRASMVACGSEAVAEQAIRLGAAPERVMVTPNGVDVERFAAGDRSIGRRMAGITGDADTTDDTAEVVVGWVGSFRPFHALDLLVDGLRELDGVHLLLVGDGPERARVEGRCRDVGVRFTSTGTVAHELLPDLLAAIDIAVVVSDRADTFHYSPLKLGEYLAAGCAVVAPDVGPVRERVPDADALVLLPPGDAGALRDVVRELRDAPARRRALGSAGEELARRTFSWDHQLIRISRHLGVDPPTSGAPARPPGGTTQD